LSVAVIQNEQWGGTVRKAIANSQKISGLRAVAEMALDAYIATTAGCLW